MTRTRLTFVALVSVAALVTAGCGSGSKSSSSSSSSDSIAVVAGTPVTRASLDDLMRTAELSYKQNKQQFPKAGTQQYQALQQQAVTFLVKQEEYEQEAKRLGVTVTAADVSKGLDTLIKQRFKSDRKTFDSYLKSTGYTLAEFNKSERIQVLRDRLTKAVTKDVKVTAAEVTAYYEKNKGSTPYTTPEQRRVRHILVALNAKGVGVSEKGVTDTKVDFPKSKKLADEIYAQLKGGASFTSLVKKYTQDPGSKSTGGAYTDVKGKFVPEFEKSAFSLKTNEISKPVKSTFGYHLIQALGPIKPGATQPLATAAKGIRSTLLQQKQSDALQKWAAALDAKYKGKVKYATGFEPPATTSTGTTTSP